jgi:uncharacterized membrane protein YfcA
VGLRELSLVALTRFSAALAPRLPGQAHRAALAMTGVLALAAYTTWLSAVAPTERSLSISLAILAASLVSSIAGFAFSALCGAMLFHLIDDPVRAVQIMMICSVGGQSLMVWTLRREIPWRSLSVFLAGAAIGLPLGIFVLLHTRPALYAQAIGVALVLYAVFMMTRRPLILRHQNALFDAMAGFLGGVTGGAAAFPGAFVTIWCSFKGWPKEKQRALYQPFILIVQLAAITIMALPGFVPQSRPAFDFAGVAYLPAMLLGSTLGMACFNRLSDRQFSLAVNLLLVASGLGFLV